MATPIGKILDHQAKQITYNVYTYYKTRKMDTKTEEHQQCINLIERVSQVTGLSKSTVTRIIQAGNAMKRENGIVKFMPQDKIKQVRKKRIEIDEFTEGTIRRKVIQFYSNKNEVPSVRKLNAMLKKEKIIDCSNEYLRQLLHKLGFTKADDSVSVGRSDVSLRLSYLQAIKQYRNEGRNIFFINETNYWEKDDTKDFVNNSDMPSIIAVFCNGKYGFNNGDTVMIKKKPELTDGKDNSDLIENYNWLKGHFIPNIPFSSVIVLNSPAIKISEINEPKPHQAATRAVMQEWLKKNNIPFKDTDHKGQLYSLIANLDTKCRYSFDKILKKMGHDVLHLPENHSDINPIHLAWERNKELDSKTPFSKFPKKSWDVCFRTVVLNENEYYDHDLNFEATVDNLLSVVKHENDSEEDSETCEDGMECDISDH